MSVAHNLPEQPVHLKRALQFSPSSRLSAFSSGFYPSIWPLTALCRERLPAENPRATATEGWLLGSQEFVARIKHLIKSPKYGGEVPAVGPLAGISLLKVLQQTADHFGVDMTSFTRKHNRQQSRDIAAWLARRLTVATLRELTGPFGLGHPDSVRSLLNRAEAAIRGSAKLRKEARRERNLPSARLIS